jgi:hypothetical protein
MSDKIDNLGKTTTGNQTFRGLQGRTIPYLAKMEFGDIAPSQPIYDAVMDLSREIRTLVKAWNLLQEKDLKSLNDKLTKAGLAPLPVSVLP